MRSALGVLGIVFIMFALNCIIFRMGAESVMIDLIKR